MQYANLPQESHVSISSKEIQIMLFSEIFISTVYHIYVYICIYMYVGKHMYSEKRSFM